MEGENLVIRTVGGFTYFGLLDAETGYVWWFSRLPEGTLSCAAAKRMFEETRLAESVRVRDQEWTLLMHWAGDVDVKEREVSAQALCEK